MFHFFQEINYLLLVFSSHFVDIKKKEELNGHL